MKLFLACLLCAGFLLQFELRADEEFVPADNTVIFSVISAEEQAPAHYQIGIATTEVPAILKKHLKLAEAGALVSDVLDKSPAKNAGLKTDDVITKIITDGTTTKITSAVQLLSLIRNSASGKYTLTFLREGKEQTVTLSGEKKSEQTNPKNLPADFNVFVTNQLKQDDQWLDQLKNKLLKIKGINEDQEIEIKRTIEESRKEIQKSYSEQPLHFPIMSSPMVFTIPPGNNPMWTPQHPFPGNINPGQQMTGQQMTSAGMVNNSNGLSISVNKSMVNGVEKTQITVKRKKDNTDQLETWTITPDQIGTLPKDIQPLVRKMFDNTKVSTQQFQNMQPGFVPFPGMMPGQVQMQGFNMQQSSGSSSSSSGGSASGSAGGSANSSSGGSASGGGNSSAGGNSSGSGQGQGMNIPGMPFQHFTPQNPGYSGNNNMEQKLDKILERLEKLEKQAPQQK